MPKKKPRSVRADLRNREGTIARRAPVPLGTTFVLCLKTGHYYDLVSGAQYIERSRLERPW